LFVEVVVLYCYKNLKTHLTAALKKVAAMGNRLFIITVEKMVRDFNVAEFNGAGSDVWKLLQENNLTGIVTKFVSYNPNGAFVQINKCKAPAGFVPYEDKYFSETRVPDFTRFIAAELKDHPDEKDQVRIAQNLSATLAKLTYDKPDRIATGIIRNFSRMFVLDSNLVTFLLTKGIQNERGGSAETYGAYRSQLKELFKEADRLLKTNVAETIGLGENFISFMTKVRDVDTSIDVGAAQADGTVLYAPPKSRILTGMSYMVNKDLTIHGTKYPRAAIGCVPVFPVMDQRTRLTDMNRQAIRQWTRAVYAALYNTNVMSDEIIYLVLGTVLIVVRSDVPEKVKASYRRLGDIMLEKKRLNTQDTERKRLDDGEHPMPNTGILSDFVKYMESVSTKLNIQATPMKLWHEMCLALDPNLAAKQARHCKDEIRNDIQIPTVDHDEMPEGAAFDYQCLISLEDISNVGGFRFVPHTNAAGNRCAPVYLLSEEGKKQMMMRDERVRVCPVCYEPMTEESFVAIGAKVEFDLPAEYKLFMHSFGRQQVAASSEQKSSKSSKPDKPDKPDKSGTGGITTGTGAPVKVVFMMGVVGAGKTTWAEECKRRVEARGGVCLVEGTDKYCKHGLMIGPAIDQVMRSLRSVSEIKNDDVVVIIDTCGERNRNKEVKAFDIQFNGRRFDVWPNYDKKNIRGYLAWSLRNVLRRGPSTPDSNYWLCPAGTSDRVCIDVHQKKAKALLNSNDYKNHWQFAGATADNLSGLADDYAKSLKPFEMPDGL